MKYRDVKYDFRDQNESRANEAERVLADARADRAERSLAIGSDRNGECEADDTGVFTDVSDVLANLRHFCDRAGINYDAVNDHARHAYEADQAEDGGEVKRDTERFPELAPAEG